MKHATSKPLFPRIALFLSSFLLFLFVLVLFCSFKTARFTDDFLKQLGITKDNADSRISSSLLSGGVSYYGLQNAKDIVAGNRRAVILEALTYAKNYAGSDAFIKKYNDVKASYKPKEETPKTPEQIQDEFLKSAKESVQQLETALKTASADLKPVFEESLKASRKRLKEIEDPNNESQKQYTETYPAMVMMYKDSYATQLAEWEKKYPSNHLLFIKPRLQQFMAETKDVDFNAELIAKNGKKYFVKPAYEHKGMYWKMAFRAGREAVEPAREFVQKWIDEIK